MPDIDRAAAAQLLRDGPPEYNLDVSTYPGPPHFEQLEMDDRSRQATGGSNWLKSLKTFGAERITRPVSRVIDPVAHVWKTWSMVIEERISKYVNILIVKRILVLVVVAIFVIGSHYLYFSDMRSLNDLKDHERLKAIIRSEISADRIRETTEYLAKMPHFAGSQADVASATYAHDTFVSYGMGALYDRHNTFLSHGNSTFFEMRDQRTHEVLFTSNFVEGEAINSHELSQKQPPTQMSLVLPGEAEGHLVYANFGSQEDFEAVDCNKTIAIVKIGQESPGDIAMRAQEMGISGILFMASKIDADEPSWPLGRDYPYDAIPQGSLGWPVKFPGDILSPGWPSSDSMVLSLSTAYIAKIPAAAISWNDAETLLRSLSGYGIRADADISDDWANNGAPSGVEQWWTGPNRDNIVKLVTNPIAENRHQIQNVFGQLKGRDESDRMVVIGARIDAMCYGTSQLAGFNVILEVARVLSVLKRKEHWEPLRSIVFVLWDGTAHNFAGSTEWVESVSKSLNVEGITYIDLDVGISGSQLQIRGNPIFELDSMLKSIHLSQSQDVTLADVLTETSMIPIPGYGNHLAFEAHTGVPTLQLGFVSPNKAVPLDSCYDSIEWMHKFGDPTWERHVALTELVASLAIEIADAPILPFNFTRFSDAVTEHSFFIKEKIENTFGSDIFERDSELKDLFEKLVNAALDTKAASGLYEQVKQDWEQYKMLNQDMSTGDIPEVLPVTRMRQYWNEKADMAIKGLIDINGIIKRNWYKNHYLGPTRHQISRELLSGVFPGIQDAIYTKSRNDLAEALRDAGSHVNMIAESLNELIF